MQSIQNLFFRNSFDYISVQISRILTPLEKKVASFAIGCFAFIALLSLSYFAYQRFYTKKETEKLDQVRSPASLQAEEDIKTLVGEGDFDNAWERFVDITTDNQPQNFSCSKSWPFLPPLELIQNRLDTWTTKEDILKRIPVELVRDCLMAYPELRQRFWTDDRLPNLFQLCNYYDIHIVDICEKSPDFAKKFVLSPCSKEFLYDNMRLQIFKAAYQSIKEAFSRDEIDIQAMKSLSLLLLNYRSVIPIEDYKRVRELKEQIIEESEFSEKIDQHFLALINLVIAKLNAHGVFTELESDIDDTVDALEKTSLSTESSSDEIEKYIEQLCQ